MSRFIIVTLFAISFLVTVYTATGYEDLRDKRASHNRNPASSYGLEYTETQKPKTFHKRQRRQTRENQSWTNEGHNNGYQVTPNQNEQPAHNNNEKNPKGSYDRSTTYDRPFPSRDSNNRSDYDREPPPPPPPSYTNSWASNYQLDRRTSFDRGRFDERPPSRDFYDGKAHGERPQPEHRPPHDHWPPHYDGRSPREGPPPPHDDQRQDYPPRDGHRPPLPPDGRRPPYNHDRYSDYPSSYDMRSPPHHNGPPPDGHRPPPPNPFHHGPDGHRPPPPPDGRGHPYNHDRYSDYLTSPDRRPPPRDGRGPSYYHIRPHDYPPPPPPHHYGPAPKDDGSRSYHQDQSYISSRGDHPPNDHGYNLSPPNDKKPKYNEPYHQSRRTNSPSFEEINLFTIQKPTKSKENTHESYSSVLDNIKSSTIILASATSRAISQDSIEEDIKPVIGSDRRPDTYQPIESEEFKIDQRFSFQEEAKSIPKHSSAMTLETALQVPPFFQVIPVTPEED